MVQSTHTVPFVHLRVQSSYSIGIGVSTPAEICAHAARTGFEAVALTDVGGTWGWPEFHRAAHRYGIKPVYGVTLGLAIGEAADAGVIPLVLIALDRTGIKNTVALASLSSPADAGGPIVESSQLKNHTEGVACIINAPELESAREGQLLEPFDPVAEYDERAGQLLELFGDRLFYGLAPGFDDSEAWIRTAFDRGIPAVVTQDVRYVGFKHYSFAAAERSADDSRPPEPNEVDAEAVDRYRFLSMTDVAPWYGRYAAAYANAALIASQVKTDLLDRLDEPVPASDAPTLLDGGVAGEYQSALEDIAAERIDRRFRAVDGLEATVIDRLSAGNHHLQPVRGG